MISKGKGLIVIPEKDVPEFKKLLVAYYENRDNGEIHTFMRGAMLENIFKCREQNWNKKANKFPKSVMMGKNKESKTPEIARLLNVREENFFTKLETPKDFIRTLIWYDW